MNNIQEVLYIHEIAVEVACQVTVHAIIFLLHHSMNMVILLDAYYST